MSRRVALMSPACRTERRGAGQPSSSGLGVCACTGVRHEGHHTHARTHAPGSSASRRPSGVSSCVSSSAPITCSSLMASDTALRSGGSGAAARKLVMSVHAPPRLLTSRHTSARGTRCISGASCMRMRKDVSWRCHGGVRAAKPTATSARTDCSCNVPWHSAAAAASNTHSRRAAGAAAPWPLARGG
jgi:hypothetical protein